MELNGDRATPIGNGAIGDKAEGRPRTLPAAVRQAFWFSLGLLLLLELWRPLYFLSDDNLTAWLPFVTTIGRQLWQGHSPFITPYLFGGNYNLLHDPSNLSLWNPLVFLLSPLAATPAYIAIVDLYCGVNLVFCAMAFAYLLCCLRRWYSLTISDNRIVFLSLSYTFSAYSLIVGVSWLTFLANEAALPIILLGCLHPQRRHGTGLITLGLVYTLMMGHLSPALFTLIFLTAFSLVRCWLDKSPETLMRWGMGVLLSALLVLPFLFPALTGYYGSDRSATLSVEAASRNSTPLSVFATSLLGGSFGALPGFVLGPVRISISQPLVSCAASWLIVLGLGLKRKWSALEISLAAGALLVVLFAVRPYWLGVVLSHLPFYRSLRWPFREIFNFLFFIHVWIALHLAGSSPRFAKAAIGGGIVVFALSHVLLNPVSFAPMHLDRRLIISGQAAAYWRELKTRLEPDSSIIAIVPPTLLKDRRAEIPFSLLGAYNYPTLFEVRSASGYTTVGPRQNAPDYIAPYEWSGVFTPEDGRRLLARNPRLKALRLLSLSPVRIALCTAHTSHEVPLPPLLGGSQVAR